MDVDELFKEIIDNLDNLDNENYNIKIPKRFKNKKEKDKILKNIIEIRNGLRHNFLLYHKKRSKLGLKPSELEEIEEYSKLDMGDIFTPGEIDRALNILNRYRKKIKKINRFQSPLSGITAKQATREAIKRKKGGYKKSRKRKRKRKRKTKRKK